MIPFDLAELKKVNNMRDVKYKSVFKDHKTGRLFVSIESWGTIKGGFKSPASDSTAQRIGDIQFTGIQDKGGQEIYEGDIVDTWPMYKHQSNCKGKGRYQKVIFEYGAFMAERFDFGWEGEGCIDLSNCTVIGNIYEHPEKLNE